MCIAFYTYLSGFCKQHKVGFFLPIPADTFEKRIRKQHHHKNHIPNMVSMHPKPAMNRLISFFPSLPGFVIGDVSLFNLGVYMGSGPGPLLC